MDITVHSIRQMKFAIRPTTLQGKRTIPQTVQNKALQLMAQLPKAKTTANENTITTLISNTISSGAVGSKAVLELLKYPAYPNMISERFRQKAFDNGKSPAQQAFERSKVASLKENGHTLSSVYLSGFHLRTIEKQLNALTGKPYGSCRYRGCIYGHYQF